MVHCSRLLSFLVAALAAPTGAQAQLPRQPLPRFVSCPLGVYLSANNGLTNPSHTRDPIQTTVNSCPLGWFSSGIHCLKTR